MSWEIVGAACAALGLISGGLNAWFSLRNALGIASLRKDLVEEKIAPLSERVAVLETEINPSATIARFCTPRRSKRLDGSISPFQNSSTFSLDTNSGNL